MTNFAHLARQNAQRQIRKVRVFIQLGDVAQGLLKLAGVDTVFARVTR
jgi:hypothetical protein